MMPSVAASLMNAVASGNVSQIANVRALRDEIQRLEDQVMSLKDLLGINMPAILGLSRQQTVILGMLFKSVSGVVASETIMSGLYGDRPDVDWPSRPDKVIQVQINALRKRLAGHGVEIETRVNVGYFMTSANKSRVRALLDAEAGDAVSRNDRGDAAR